MNTLENLFSSLKETENGDLSYNKVSNNKLLNILFLTEYYQKHIDEVHIGTSDKEKLFSRFIRDPRYGLGRRDLGRELMLQSQVSIQDTVKSGRVDDLFYKIEVKGFEYFSELVNYLRTQIKEGNELVKKWMPRYSSKNKDLARLFAKAFRLNKQEYGHFIKCNTTENKLSRHNENTIEFEKVPSLAMIKYANAFMTKESTKERYLKYLEDVKSGKKDLKISTTTVYDIYKNRTRIDADLFFSRIEKIQGSWIPIVDTSGSMESDDAMGKALAIGHYLSKCSTYCPNKVISFSSRPQLITLGKSNCNNWFASKNPPKSTYEVEINSMFTGDYTNTDFGKVMQLLSNLEGNMPQYLIVLSDMEFDKGSSMSKDRTMALFKEKGYSTRIIWWNLNSRNITCPEMDKDGNIFISGYNPLILKYLESGFNGENFLNRLLLEYKAKMCM